MNTHRRLCEGVQNPKSVLAKPSGKRRTISGRRYGRRYAHVMFSPRREDVTTTVFYEDGATDANHNLPPLSSVKPIPPSHQEKDWRRGSPLGHRVSQTFSCSRRPKRNHIFPVSEHRPSPAFPDASHSCKHEPGGGGGGADAGMTVFNPQRSSGKRPYPAFCDSRGNEVLDFHHEKKGDLCECDASIGAVAGPREGHCQPDTVVRPKIREAMCDTRLDQTTGPQQGFERGFHSLAVQEKWISPNQGVFLPTCPEEHSLLHVPPCLSDVCAEDREPEDDEDEKNTTRELADRREASDSERDSEEDESGSLDSWASDSGLEEEEEEESRSCEESWETLLDMVEFSDSSGSLNEVSSFDLDIDEEVPLEDVEDPFVVCFEDLDSCSDDDEEEEELPAGRFDQPQLLVLDDDNNNQRDDSSLSEDQEEWSYRLLDVFGEDAGSAQAWSHVDYSGLITHALEQSLAEALEVAFSNLESMAEEVEQACPPASEQMIHELPQIPVLLSSAADQDQSCAICCCEYVKSEMVTRLPCHHVFHKLCVTLWLKKSGTCPVCRHVLTPVQETTTTSSDPESSRSGQ